jgi:hypothetical protein
MGQWGALLRDQLRAALLVRGEGGRRFLCWGNAGRLGKLLPRKLTRTLTVMKDMTCELIKVKGRCADLQTRGTA